MSIENLHPSPIGYLMLEKIYFTLFLCYWQVLALGGSKDPIDVLSDFLGREPSIQAFVESKAQSGV